MKFASSRFCFVLASAALFFAGCTKKLVRPDPQGTILGPPVGPTSLTNTPPTDVLIDPNAGGLTQRPSGFGINGQNPEVLRSQTVYFGFNQSDIRPAERVKLQEAKKYLDANPSHRLLLEGHCDWRGTAEYNLGLGERRASAMKKYLQTLGVSADRLEAVSKGSLDASKNADESSMAKDRRGDLIVVDPKLAGSSL
ncbi:MAG: OmpA family protein [Opitutaceae bacterium]